MFIILLTSLLNIQEPEPAKRPSFTEELVALQPNINTAINAGVEWLKSRQLIDGSWEDYAETYEAGVTPVALYALLRCGLPPNHPTIKRGFHYLEYFDFKKTYSAGFYLLALAARGQKSDLKKAVRSVAWLLETLPPAGLYGYPGYPDLSNHVVAILGLNAASKQFGIEVPVKAWESMLAGTLSCLSGEKLFTLPDGNTIYENGFVYRPPGEEASGSMVSAGITALHIILKQLKGKTGAKIKRLRREAEQSLGTSLQWLANHFTVKNNPPNRSWHYFHLYGMERVGGLLNTNVFGNHRWYIEGSEFLINKQTAGAWPAGTGQELQTAMALLFLKRATSIAWTGPEQRNTKKTYETSPDKDVVIKASGDTPMSIWVADSRVEGTGASFFAKHEDSKEFSLIGVGEKNSGRLALLHSFAFPGKWLIKATVETPAGKITSPDLEVSIEMVMREDLLRYSKDQSRNKLTGKDFSIRVSSEKGPLHVGELAFNNKMDSGWACAAEDKEPWILIDFERPIKAQSILISPLHPFGAKGIKAKPKDLQIIVNKRDLHNITLENTFNKKGVIKLAKKTSIRRLDIRIKTAHQADLGTHEIGIAEIALQ